MSVDPATNNSNDDDKVMHWKEYDDFYSAHELQLFGMQFPKELCQKLYIVLKNEVFNSDEYFEIIDNQEEKRYMLRAKKSLIKNDLVFLIDHAWTFKLRQYNYFCENFPNIIKRTAIMLKYGDRLKKIIDMSNKNNEDKKFKDVKEYNLNLLKENNYTFLIYDDYKIDDNNLEEFVIKYIKNETETLSLEDNNIENIQLIYDEILDKFKNIKCLYLRDNTFCEVNENYEKEIIEKFPNIQILNRKLTKNANEWALNYLLNNLSDINYNKNPDLYTYYNNLYGIEKNLDLNDRDPFVCNFEIFKNINNNQRKIVSIDLRENNYDYNNKEMQENLINFLKSFPNTLENIYFDIQDEYLFSEDSDIQSDETYSIFLDKDLLNKIKSTIPNIKYLNYISLDKILSKNDKISLYQLFREFYVHKYMWNINRTYRLVTSEKYDEDPIWYINDEFGSAINHSDVPNCCMFPFIYSKSGKFEENELITYSILWPKKDIKKGDEIFIDFLTNINEEDERSSRLTCWYDTPRKYFINKFNEKLKKYNKIKNDNKYENFLNQLDKLFEMTKKKENISDELIKNIFNFNMAGKDENLINKTISKIKISLENFNNEINLNKYFIENFNNSDKKIKVCTDLPYVKNNLKLNNIEFTNDIVEADIIWINSNIFTLLDENKIELKNKGENVYFNQFPYESVITFKSNLTYLIQENLGINNIIGLSYEMKTELAEIIGNYFYNEDFNLNNTWILKPINMSRSMDMVITNNLKQIIRALETGPKICQKYINKPFKMYNKKFDLRFIIAVKNIFPLELYFYNKMFWIRCSNKEYNEDSLSFDDYEIHFTVMNYSNFNMKTVYDKDFINYLKENNIEWEPIYKKLKEKVKKIFVLASKDCPQMINYCSRAIYGLDAMIDEKCEPYVIEINFQPDCTRACNFIPEFYNDIFNLLFFDKNEGAEKV